MTSRSEGHAPRTKQQVVYQSLRDAIMHCELAPGQRITTDEMARRFSVSLIPVREALQQLQAEGLVTTIPHTGTVVAPISPQSITEIFIMLEGLELVATRVAAERLTEEGEHALTRVLHQMDDTLRAGRHDEWSDLNTRFHLSIARLTDMPMLRDMTARVLSRWDRLRRYYFSGVLSHRMEQSQQEHWALMRALHDRDYTQLERSVKIHNRGALAAYREYIAIHPEASGNAESATRTA
ncbi:MAG: GntR family transcriptional regulator [Chloroflexota bacterium]